MDENWFCRTLTLENQNSGQWLQVLLRVFWWWGNPLSEYNMGEILASHITCVDTEIC